MKYKRVLLKLSGEVFQGAGQYGIDPVIPFNIANELKDPIKHGVEVAIVIGGGNIFRGIKAAAGGMDRTTADYMGMLATVMNGMALLDALEKINIPTRVQSPIEIKQLAEPFIRRRALRHLEKGRCVIFVGGTGSPYFTTDTTAALRASEIDADLLLKATKVDGVFTGDPLIDTSALLIQKMTYMDVLNKKLKVMDATAISLCMDNRIPIRVFNMTVPGNISKVLMGEPLGTEVYE